MASRRTFLTHSCGFGVAALTTTSTMFSLGFARQAAAHAHSDYKALVCLMLAGGNDSYNMLVPYDQDQYDEYNAFRSDLAVSRDSLMSLPENKDGRVYGFHAGMAEMHDLYINDEVALINNVGTLLEPIDPHQLQAGKARVPVGLYSHSDQQTQWQTAVSYSRSANQGWGGRIADLEGPELANGISMNVSLDGTNVFQSGARAVPYNINPGGDGAEGIYAYHENQHGPSFRKQMIDSLFRAEHSNLLRSEYAWRMRKAIDNQRTFVEALRSSPELTTEFSEERLSRAMRQIARVIGARGALGAHRQTFFVVSHGWDHHDEVLDNQNRMLPEVSRALKEFRDALMEMGVYDDVTTFTISEFARTLTSNGKGSDHGWGGHQLVMGGAVNGGQMLGTYPLIHQNHPMDTGRGVFMPTTSTEEYFGELALWFGVPSGDLDHVLPNVHSFYSPADNARPLGFMA